MSILLKNHTLRIHEVILQKIGLVITTYNRPDYLKRTIDSLSHSFFPAGSEIYIIDDNSNAQTKQIIKSCNIGVKTIKTYNPKNKGMFYGLKTGFTYFYESGFDIISNIDSDAIVKPYWLIILNQLLKEFPESIISGFNAHQHHFVLETFNKYYVKNSIGGINLFFNRNLCPFILPYLTSNQWDWELSAGMRERKISLIVTKPSVIDHIGGESSLGHKGADVAKDFQK